MDLRATPIPDEDLAAMRRMILSRKVAYQPFVFRDDLEVGEGWAFATDTSDIWPPHKEVVYWPDHPAGLDDLAVSERNRHAFAAANATLRSWYEDNLRLIIELVGDVADHDFLELGCNTGYLLHRLSAAGARRAIGVDSGDFGDVFDWFNRVTGSSSEFVHAAWDSTHHRMMTGDLTEVDVTISVSMTCHVADPLHMLAYLCQKARHAVFFMVPLSGKDDVSLTFGHAPEYFGGCTLWPSNFDSRVLPSARLVELGLQQCGFGDVRRPKDNVFVARRSGPGRSIYTPEAFLTRTSVQPELIEEGYRRDFNIIRCNGRYYALAQDEGAFQLTKADRGEYRRCFVAQTLPEVKRRVG
jgi:SAM-dependent methyltransferase